MTRRSFPSIAPKSLVCLAAPWIVAACGGADSAPAGPPATGVAHLSDLPGKAVVLWVDRDWARPEAGAGKASVPLPASEYTPVPPERRYRLEISADRKSVAITPLLTAAHPTDAAYTGALTASSDTGWEYDLTPAFAGAQLRLWPERGKVAAEITVLGSGVPVVSSVRGVLGTP